MESALVVRVSTKNIELNANVSKRLRLLKKLVIPIGLQRKNSRNQASYTPGIEYTLMHASLGIPWLHKLQIFIFFVKFEERTIVGRFVDKF